MDSNGSTETLSWSWPNLIPSSPPPPVYQTSPCGGEGPGDEARSWPWLSIVSLDPGLIPAPNLWHSFGVARQKSGMVNPGLRLNKMVGHLHTCTHTRPTSLVHVLVLLNTVTFFCYLFSRTQWSLRIWMIVSTCVRGLRPSWPKHQLTPGIHDMCSSIGLRQFSWLSYCNGRVKVWQLSKTLQFSWLLQCN